MFDAGEDADRLPYRQARLTEIKGPSPADRLGVAGAYITRAEARSLMIATSAALFALVLVVGWVAVHFIGK